jgi:hypothetical protein
MSCDYEKSIKVLIQYAEQQGFKVDLNHDDISEIKWFELNKPKVIKIQSKNIEYQVYEFLHELGHHELRKNWSEYKKVLPTVAYAESVKPSKYKRRIGYYVSSLEEEYKAWDKGLELANQLDIKVKKIKWNTLKTKCLMSYIRHFGKK